MKIKITSTLGAIFVASMLSSFAGAISGTVAWYASNTRATASYSGTSVYQSEQIQIGLESTVDFVGNNQNLGLTREENTNYYWAEIGAGIKSDAINAYLSKTSYATDELAPVTSMGYEAGDTFALKKAPMAYSTVIHNASTSSYCQIKFIFRVTRADADGNEFYSPNEKVWVTEAVAKAQTTTDKDIFKALRVHFDGKEVTETTNHFILNPSSEETAVGGTKAAGLLDLNKDGYYDCDGYGKEIIYGDIDRPQGAAGSSFASDDLEDVNGTGKQTLSTFVAKHKQGTTGYTKAQLDAVEKGVAKYETMSTIAPNDNGGNLTGGKYVAITSDDENAVAHLTTTIYLEGWDHSVIDLAIGSKFNLGLQFQVTRAA